MVVGKKVILKDETGDDFGRVLALVYVNNKLVNETMLSEGFLIYQGGSSSEKDKLQKAADDAREKKLGIYSENGEKIYHFLGCSGYENNVVIEKDLGEKWFCSEKEAQAAGFVKSEKGELRDVIEKEEALLLEYFVHSCYKVETLCCEGEEKMSTTSVPCMCLNCMGVTVSLEVSQDILNQLGEDQSFYVVMDGHPVAAVDEVVFTENDVVLMREA